MGKLWESGYDRSAERRAMLVMELHLGLEFVQTDTKSHVDFYTREVGYICEHKRRGMTMQKLHRLGSVYLEVAKHQRLIEASRKRGDRPLFVVTLACGSVVYAAVNERVVWEVEVAHRRPEIYRGPGDEDPCYKVPAAAFRTAGILGVGDGQAGTVLSMRTPGDVA